MVTIEQLMQYGTRRKVEGIAAEMGYPKGTKEYPDSVLEEVKKRCSKKQSVSERVADTAEQETDNTFDADLKKAQCAGERRAAGMLMAMDSVMMMCIATRKFSDPDLQQMVDSSQKRVDQFFSNVEFVYDPENFLEQIPLAQIAVGESGSTRSLPGSRNLSSESEPETKPEKPEKE